MAEETHTRRWANLPALVGPVLTVAGILVGIWQFNAGETNRNSAEFRRTFWLQKVEAYQSIARVTGDVVAAYETESDDREEVFRRFLSAYWGAMILVEDAEVEAAMKRFYLELRDVRSGWSTETNELKVAADSLIKACRASMDAERPAPN